MGTLPHTFSGDRTQVEQFMEEVRTYLCLNNDVAGFDSPIKQVYFTLSCMKGDDVAGWVRDVGEVVEQLDPINDNITEVWNHFVVEFTNQYMNSAREDRAQAKLETLKMKDGLIDEYIAKFEELCRQAGYVLNSPNATRLFLQGLSRHAAKDVVRSPPVRGYEQIKGRAVESVASQRILDSLFPGKGGPYRPPQNRGPFLGNSNFLGQSRGNQ